MALKHDRTHCPHCFQPTLGYWGVEAEENDYGVYSVEIFECEECGLHFEEDQLDWFEDWSEYLAPDEKVMKWKGNDSENL